MPSSIILFCQRFSNRRYLVEWWRSKESRIYLQWKDKFGFFKNPYRENKIKIIGDSFSNQKINIAVLKTILNFVLWELSLLSFSLVIIFPVEYLIVFKLLHWYYKLPFIRFFVCSWCHFVDVLLYFGCHSLCSVKFPACVIAFPTQIFCTCVSSSLVGSCNTYELLKIVRWKIWMDECRSFHFCARFKTLLHSLVLSLAYFDCWFWPSDIEL